MDSQQHRLLIEKYTLLTDALRPGGKLDYWYSFYVPASPGECELMDMAVMSSYRENGIGPPILGSEAQRAAVAVAAGPDSAAEQETLRVRDAG